MTAAYADGVFVKLVSLFLYILENNEKAAQRFLNAYDETFCFYAQNRCSLSRRVICSFRRTGAKVKLFSSALAFNEQFPKITNIDKDCYIPYYYLERSFMNMNVSLTPELETLVNEKVKSGNYNSASEVVREALRLLKEQDELKRIRRDELRREVMKGVDEIRNGQGTIYNSAEELAETVINRGKAGKAKK
jgi:antitoxin ParD1/3/4